MLDLIVAAMGGSLQDPAVQRLLDALGASPAKPAKPSSDGYVVASHRGRPRAADSRG